MTKDVRPDWNAIAVIQWLMREGRLLPDRNAMITGLGERLAAEGAPICRVRLSMRTLHPLVRVVSVTWEAETGVIPVIEARHGFESNPTFVGSPIEIITRTQAPYRKRLEEPLGPDDPAMLTELKEKGLTDYFGRRLRFSSGTPAIFIVNSATPGGFTDADIDKINLIAGALSPVVEVFDARQVAVAVAEAYLGPRTGRQVLDGQITRGDIDTIEAAILISDIRGWTRINREMAPEEAVALANRYFDGIAAAVDAHGGEILKFLGDGVLAIFPGDAETACNRALAAARMAQDAADGIDFGIGLHFGQVMYGNVGSVERIDFTVLGQAVNLAARIEGQCAELEEPVLYSDTFARAVSSDSREVARRMLKGFDEETVIRGPAM